MAEVIVNITTDDGVLLDRFKVYRGGRAKPAFSKQESSPEYTPEMLAEDLRSTIDHRYQVEDKE